MTARDSLGFTGTRSLTLNDVQRVVDYADQPEIKLWLQNFGTFVTGACIGFDAVIGSLLALKFPAANHVVVVPADRSRVVAWWEDFDPGMIMIIEMPDATTYKDRNQKIVDLSSSLFYCADHTEEHSGSRRSGTWQTVRLARKAGLEPSGIVLHPGVQTRESAV